MTYNFFLIITKLSACKVKQNLSCFKEKPLPNLGGMVKLGNKNVRKSLVKGGKAMA